MPVAVCCEKAGEEVVVVMRNTHIEVWSLLTGKRKAILENFLDDWTTYNNGNYIQYRHLVSNGAFFVYASYRAPDFFIGNVDDLNTEAGRVDVFTPYEFDENAEDTDFTPRNMDHIGAIGIMGNGKQVILSNGKDQTLHFYDIQSGDKLQIIQFKGDAQMRSIFFPPDANWFYFCNKDSLGVMDMDAGDAHSMLPHSCRTHKVVGAGGRYVVSIAEDSILRIWDLTMDAYTTDVSQFTGKVKVASEQAAAKAKKNFEDMFAHIVGNGGGLPDTKELLTTEEIENYWTKEVRQDQFDDLVSSKAITQFHMYKNLRYVGVSHRNIHNGYAFCFTIWEVIHINCVRRMFFPHDTVYVYEVINDEFVLLCENRRLKLMDIKGLAFKVCQVFQGQTVAKHMPTVVYNSFSNGKWHQW